MQVGCQFPFYIFSRMFEFFSEISLKTVQCVHKVDQLHNSILVFSEDKSDLLSNKHALDCSQNYFELGMGALIKPNILAFHLLNACAMFHRLASCLSFK